LDYLIHLRDSVTGPLINEGVDGVAATLSVMQKYYLLREDIDSLMELSLWPNQKDPFSHVDSKVMGHMVLKSSVFLFVRKDRLVELSCICYILMPV
jgi:replication factor C subunit 1